MQNGALSKDLIKTAATAIVASLITGAFTLVGSITAMGFKLDSLAGRVQAVEQQHKESEEKINQMAQQVYWLYQVHGGKGEQK